MLRVVAASVRVASRDLCHAITACSNLAKAAADVGAMSATEIGARGTETLRRSLAADVFSTNGQNFPASCALSALFNSALASAVRKWRRQLALQNEGRMEDDSVKGEEGNDNEEEAAEDEGDEVLGELDEDAAECWRDLQYLGLSPITIPRLFLPLFLSLIYFSIFFNFSCKR